MSNSITVEPMPLPNQKTAKPARSLGAMIQAVLESMVAAQTRRFDVADPLTYRFPAF